MMEFPAGWARDPEAVQQIISRQSTPFFRTYALNFSETIPEEVFLWKAAVKVLGGLLPATNQGQVGSCVSFGTASAVEHTMLCEIAGGDPEEYKPLVQELIYGGSRFEIGGGKISGDGSIGAWAAEFVKQYGVISRAKYFLDTPEEIDLEKYNEKLCRAWGKTGVPTAFETIAKRHPVKTISMVSSFIEAKVALANGYGIAVCSNRGFNTRRDDDGFCNPSGDWGHCMALLGYKSGRRHGGFLLNSWGDDGHSGPMGAGDPPASGFWADAKVLDRMLAEGDSWAFSAVEGFPQKKINWNF